MLKDFTQMTPAQCVSAHLVLQKRFSLSLEQSQKVQSDPMRDQIWFAAHNEHWITAECLLKDARIL